MRFENSITLIIIILVNKATSLPGHINKVVSCGHGNGPYSRYIPLPWQSDISRCLDNMPEYISVSILFHFWAIACMTNSLYYIRLTNVFVTLKVIIVLIVGLNFF